MRILYVTTIGSTMNFFKLLIRSLLDEGHIVDIATNEDYKKVPTYYSEWGCKVYPISCVRSPFKKNNVKAIKQIRQIVDKNNYDLVHCHTPIASICARLACRPLRKKGIKVIYTAHGFHFYKGAPLINWLLYYPLEKLCSRWTDVIITINKEDYSLARRKMKARKVEYVPGVGIDIARFQNTIIDKSQKRREIGIPENSFMLLSVGELNKNKNHSLVIRAIAKSENLKIHYVIAGEGSNRDYLINLANKLGISKQIHLLGYRTDVDELCKAADVYVHPSFREGLPVSVMEAMASGLPVICSKIRGNMDLIDEKGGFLLDPNDADEFRDAIESIFEKNLFMLGKNNQDKIACFSFPTVLKKMQNIYNDCCDGKD